MTYKSDKAYLMKDKPFSIISKSLKMDFEKTKKELNIYLMKLYHHGFLSTKYTILINPRTLVWDLIQTNKQDEKL